MEQKSNRSLTLAAAAKAAVKAPDLAVVLAAAVKVAVKVAVKAVDLDDLVVATDILPPYRGNPPAAEEEADT
jgi:hypothetical protein